MRGYLLDTCVISESTRPKASDKVMRWLDSRPAETLFLSVLTVAEIEQGIAQTDSVARARKLQKWLVESVLPMFSLRILGIDLEHARSWGRAQGQARRLGRTAAVIDSLLAATAKAHGLILVTRNVKDFADFDIEVVNPWI